MSYDPIALRRRELQRQIADAQRQLDTIQLVPTDDTYPDGTIIRAQIREGSADAMTWVFLKVVGTDPGSLAVRWYHTGYVPHDTRNRAQVYFTSWHSLQAWLIDRGRVVESWQPLIAPLADGTLRIKLSTPPRENDEYITARRVGHQWEEL